MYFSSKGKKQLPHENKKFIRQFLPQPILNRFLVSKTYFVLEQYNLHSGIEISTKNQLIITSKKINSNLESCQQETRKYYHSSICISSGYQNIKNRNIYFQVYSKNGCSLQQFLSNIKHLQMKHILLLCGLFIKLAKTLNYHKISLKYLDLRTILININIDTKNRSQVTLQVLHCALQRQKSYINVEKQQNNSIAQPTKKEVRFNFSVMDKPRNKKTIQFIIKKLIQLYDKVKSTNSPHFNQYNRLFQNLITFIGKYCIKYQDKNHYSGEFIDKIWGMYVEVLDKLGQKYEILQEQILSYTNSYLKYRIQIIQKLFQNIELEQQQQPKDTQIEIQIDSLQIPTEGTGMQHIKDKIQMHTFDIKQHWRRRFYAQTQVEREQRNSNAWI